MGHTIKMNAHVIYKWCWFRRTADLLPTNESWVVPPVCKCSSRTAAEGRGTQECPANSCCVTLSIAVRARLPNRGLFQKVSPRKHYAECYDIAPSTIRPRQLPITCTKCSLLM